MPYLLDPLTDPRWLELLQSNPAASVFHSRPWLSALRDTYGYQPLALTSSAPGEMLRDGLVFCRIYSWLTGRRWVSAPFSDHAEPLLADPAALTPLLRAAEEHMLSESLRSIEIRPQHALPGGFAPDYQRTEYALHNLDLSPDLETLFRNLHTDSIQRKIRRAQREALQYSTGRSAEHLDAFYLLLQRTRRRHSIPPQPRAWFEILARNFGPQLTIHLASHRGLPIAAMLTLVHKSTLVYKYGCSDETQHPLGGMQLIMWRAIEAAKQQGLTGLDLGRSDLDNPGLITYKNRWGAIRTPLVYLRKSRYPSSAPKASQNGWKRRLAGSVFAHLPATFSSAAGRVLYRHLG